MVDLNLGPLTKGKPYFSCNFLENHGLGVTRSHARVLRDMENFKISPFPRLGLTCSRNRVHLVSLGVTRFHLVSLGFTWCHLVSLGLGVTSLGVTRFHLLSLGFTWCHSVSLWRHLVSLGFTWCHTVRLNLTYLDNHYTVLISSLFTIIYIIIFLCTTVKYLLCVKTF